MQKHDSAALAGTLNDVANLQSGTIEGTNFSFPMVTFAPKTQLTGNVFGAFKMSLVLGTLGPKLTWSAMYWYAESE